MAVLAIDFDNTMVNGAEPLPGVRDAINLFREYGHKVVIHSCNNQAWIEKVLHEHDIRYDYIWDQVGKPICDLYIDDKGYKFPYNGDWSTELPRILSIVSEKDNRKWTL